jgi:hypothetical protein
MKKIILITVLNCCLVFIASCQNNINNNQLVIKTIVPKGSVHENEFGKKTDWIEIYNNSEEEIDLGQGKWYLTDNVKRPKKFKLPAITIKANNSVIVWCDDANRVKKEIHTNFKLSSYGETLMLSYKNDKEIITIDTVSYEPVKEDEQMAICRTSSGLVFRKLAN